MQLRIADGIGTWSAEAWNEALADHAAKFGWPNPRPSASALKKFQNMARRAMDDVATFNAAFDAWDKTPKATRGAAPRHPAAWGGDLPAWHGA